MAKIYAFVSRIETRDGAVYAHVGGDQAFSSNAKATTAKREYENEYELSLTNWSFTLQDSSTVPAPGTKVYTVLHKSMVGGRRVLLWPDGERGRGWLSKNGAQAWRKANGGRESGLIIFSFVVDETPEQEFDVTITVRARSLEEAEQKAHAALNGNSVAVHGVPVR